ncbi:hypothetical protein DCC39_12390 [Pueribacillus theae]|uniref:Uncharacterized protein n=1 Tax=Pueribacillus theae TaxID=2171751 RepID=A0A2U1JX15_9BACI|nr:ABC transporter permease subunit [Pueribacillus theae]PWA09756.1 hypothetical protein DCC39_12390 [Pueribacillus theae]
MKIILLECKKAVMSPIILALLLLFTAWNIFQIYDHSKLKEGLDVANELAKKYGVTFSDESLAKLEEDLKAELADLNAITEKIDSRTFESAFDFFNQLKFEDQERYSKNELHSFYETYVKEMYADMATSMDADYASFDMKRMGEDEISRFGLTGAAAETLRKEYAQFADRFEALQANNEHKQWFFAGKQYGMHSLLFRTMFRSIVIETMILVVLATAFITNYEFENRTQLVTYATRRGRRFMLDKLVASLIATSGITIFLLVVTLSTYFSFFDYSHLWKTAISSGFNWEFNFPYVSWWNLSFLNYLVLGILLFYVCMLLFSAFTFALSVLIKNSYFTFILFAGIFIMLFIVQSFLPTSSNVMLMAGFNLSTLVLNPHQWWMGSSGLTMFKYHELLTVGAWAVIFAILCVLALKKFAKQDIS